MVSMRRGDDSRAGRGAVARPAVVLPLVRAALARGEGPPAVVAWVRRQGPPPAARDLDARARALAARLAAVLGTRLRGEARTLRPGSTRA